MSEMGRHVVRIRDVPYWLAPTPDKRRFRGLVEPVRTGSGGLAAGTLILPPAQEQASSARHPNTEEIYYVIRGRGQIELAGEFHPIEAGTLVYVPRDTDHRLVNTDPVSDLEIL